MNLKVIHLRLWPMMMLLGLGLSMRASAQDHVTAPPGGRVSEWWHEPARPGWGLVITHSGANSVVVYTGHAANGREEWNVGVGPRATDFRADLLRSRKLGGQTTQVVVGEVSMQRLDDDHARARIVRHGLVSEHALERVVLSRDFAIADYSGVWLNPAQPGLSVVIMNQADTLAALVTGYDEAGEPRWWLGHASMRPYYSPGIESIALSRYRYGCGAGCPLLAESAGSLAIKPIHDRELAINMTLSLRPADSHLEPAPTFIDRARYYNLGEPATGRIRQGMLRPFHSDAAVSAYLSKVRENHVSEQHPYYICYDGFSPPWQAFPWLGQNGSHDAGLIPSADIVVSSGEDVAALASEGDRRVFRLYRVSSQTTAVRSLATLPADPGMVVHAVLALPPTADGRRFLLIERSDHPEVPLGCYLPRREPKTRLRWITVDAAGLVHQGRELTMDMLASDVFLRNQDVLVVASSPILIAENDTSSMARTHAPSWRVDQGPANSLLRAASTYLSPGGYLEVNSILRVPVDDPAATRAVSVFQRSPIVHVGQDAIYFAGTHYQRIDELTPLAGYYTRTALSSIDPETLAVQSDADLIGDLERMGASAIHAWQGDLHILTDTRLARGEAIRSMAKLSVLRDNGQGQLLPIGVLPNRDSPLPLGRDNEWISRIRFLDDRAYLGMTGSSTTEFSFDLSRPDQPRIEQVRPAQARVKSWIPLPDRRLLGLSADVQPAASPGLPDEVAIDLGLSAHALGAPRIDLQQIALGGERSSAALWIDARAYAASLLTDNRYVVTTTLQTRGLPNLPIELSLLRATYRSTSLDQVETKLQKLPASGNVSYARTVIVGERVYLFLDGRVFGDRLDSNSEVLTMLNVL